MTKGRYHDYVQQRFRYNYLANNALMVMLMLITIVEMECVG